MKNNFKMILGFIMVLSLLSMSSANKLEVVKLVTPITELDCNNTYTVCDNYVNYLNRSVTLSYELEFKYFDRCMIASGC